jgi:HSP20 family protein
LTRRESVFLTSPFALLQRLADGMTSVFDDLTFGSVSLAPRSGQATAANVAAFAPDIDVFQRGNELVVRADLPGVNADDVVVEVSDDAITISGERRQEHEEERGGVYRFERSYGSFLRTIPLPEGAIADQAKANFKDGVLEITMPAPPEQVSRGRRLEISKGGDGKSKDEGKKSA